MVRAVRQTAKGTDDETVAEPAEGPEKRGYRRVWVPAMLLDSGEEIVKDNAWGIRSVQEFVAMCIRDGFTKYGQPPPHKKPKN